MKGYRALLNQSYLHNQPSILQLLQKNKQLNKLANSFIEVQKQVDENIQQIKSTMQFIFNKSNSFVSNFIQEIEIQLKKIRDISYQFKCFCGVKTNQQQIYVEHIKKQHKKHQFNVKSTHMVTFFGNTLRYSPNRIKMFQNNQNSQQIHQKSQCNLQPFIKTPKQQHEEDKVFQRQKNRKKIKPRIQKIHLSQKKQAQLKIKTANQQKNLTKDNQQLILKQKIKADFFCGECKRQFQIFKSYVLHIRSHDFIIHPDSSHIIIRKKNGKSQPIPTKDQETSTLNYYCPCKPNLKFSKKQFVSHVFKWHKGIAPRK